MEVASLKEEELSYRGGHFNGGSMVMLQSGHFNGRRMVMLQRWCLMKGAWSCYIGQYNRGRMAMLRRVPV